MDKKKICYICTGCGIGDAFDIEDFVKYGIEDEWDDYDNKSHEALCSEAGVAMIKEDIEAGYNTISIAACSPRVMHDAFDFEGVLVDRANIREQALMCTPDEIEDDDEDDPALQMLARDYIRMSLAKLDKMNLPEAYTIENLSKRILVVGGGKSGLTAANMAAKAGYEVLLVEKEAELGGYMAKMKATSPLHAPYKELEPTGMEDLVEEVTGNDKIEVITGATIDKIAGMPGDYDVFIGGSEEAKRAGAVVLATGWQPYEPEKLPPELGYGTVPNVVTNVEFEEMAKSGQIKRPADGGPVKNVAFIQCAGSRDPDHLPYCSAICCQVSMKQAAYVKEMDPEANTFIIYRDIRTPGQAEDFYRATQEGGTTFIRAENRTVGNGYIEAEDELLGETVRIENLDLIVLATGMVSTTNPTKEIIEAQQAKIQEIIDKGGEAPPIIEKYGPPILNLDYRQNGELPILKNGFVDSNFICFPYETRRTGIYACGPVRRPMGLSAAAEDATGATMKAIQAIEAAAIGQAVHPRVGDLSFPEINLQRCTQCRRCTDECPFGAIEEDADTNPIPNPSRCRRCGTCMGACPERVISFKNYSVGMIGDMIKAIEVPEEDEEKPRVLVLCCENDAYPALDMAAMKGHKWSPYVRFVPMRCLGGINLVWIADSLSNGLDGILLLGCKHGDDYQCHFVRGSELAGIRMSKIEETLTRLSLESERIRVEQVSIVDHDRIPEIIEEFMEEMDDVGPNPFKDL